MTTILVEVELEVEWFARDLFKAVIDYRHPTFCELCKHEFIANEPVSVVRDKNLPNLIICYICAGLVQEQLDKERESDG